MIFIVILYALIALTFPLAKQATVYAHPLFVVAVRMIVASIGYLLFHRFFAKKQTVMRPEDFWLFVKAAFFHIYLAFVPEFWALQYLPALEVNMIYCATPFISAFFEFFLLNRTFSLIQYSGMCIGIAGVLFLAFATAPKHCIIATCPYPYLPELSLFVAVISASYAWFMVRKLIHKGYPLSFINGVCMFIGGCLSALTLPFFKGNTPLVSDLVGFCMVTAALIIIANGIIYQLYGSLLKHYRPTLLSLAGFLSPIFGAIYMYFLSGEPLSWHYGISLVMILIGLLAFCQTKYS